MAPVAGGTDREYGSAIRVVANPKAKNSVPVDVHIGHKQVVRQSTGGRRRRFVNPLLRMAALSSSQLAGRFGKKSSEGRARLVRRVEPIHSELFSYCSQFSC
jgi:hypothetical protein